MAHEIYEERFLSRGQVAWHSLGTVIPQDEVLTTVDAFTRVKLDTTMSKVPLYADVPDGAGGSIRMEIPDRVALVRDADRYGTPPKYIGDVHPKYPFLQNMEIAEFLKPFSDTTKGGWPVETVGLLKDGELIFVTLRAGGAGVGPKGDPIDEFFLFTDYRDGQHPAEVAQVTKRVVCANTLRWALGSSPNRVTVRHTRDFKDRVTFYATTMATLRGLNLEARQWWNRFAATPLTQEQIKALFEGLWKLPAKPEQHAIVQAAMAAGHTGRDLERQVDAYKEKVEAWEKHTERIERTRADALVLFGRLGDEFAQAGTEHTAWHAYNTVTQWATTYKGREVQQSVMFGERGEIVQKAFQLLTPLAAEARVPDSWGSQSRPQAVMGVATPSTSVVTMPTVRATIGKPVPAGSLSPATAPVGVQRSPLEKALKALDFVNEVHVANQRPFTAEDVDSTPLLRRAALSWLRGTPALVSNFGKDMRSLDAKGHALSDNQVRAVLNMMVGSRGLA
jgi:phage/plasmid-like protein (TIGR03299 family)